MTDGSAAPPSSAHAPTRPGLVLLVVCAAQFMVILDASIVNLALPDIGRSFDLTTSDLQWVVNAYAIVFAGFLLLGGRLADLFGRRQVFAAGLIVFTLASLGAGLAPGPGWLVAGRVVQGLGAAVLAPTTLTVLVTTFTEPKERGRAIGLWSAVAASGGAVGSLLGGVITDYLDWRWVFLVNVPIGVVLVVLARAAVTDLPMRRSVRLDVAGAVAVTAGIAFAVAGAVATVNHAWGSSAVLLPLAAALVLLVAFVVIEARIAQPIVPLSFFRNRNATLANLIALAGGTAMVATFFFLSLFLQDVMRLRPVEAGLAFLPMSVAIVAGTTVSMKQLAKLGPRPLLIGGGVVTLVGLLWLAGAGASATFLADLLGPTLLIGLGMGMVMVPITSAATAGIDPAQAGLASGIISTTRQLGGALGLAGLVAAAGSHARAAVSDGSSAIEGLASGYARGFVLSAVLIAIGTVVSFFLVPARTPAAPPAAPPPAPTAAPAADGTDRPVSAG